MVRAPCCEKMGVKKGAWSPEEDEILTNYIHKYGHGNWRALPKQAGLLRCGKSCRLRWINYLKPDIKRGNFTQQEEQTIINLHQMLGNRWSAIAARLPGRTDNEIKNVWHTHLKKKLKDNKYCQDPKRLSISECANNIENVDIIVANSPQRCSSEISSVTDSSLEKIAVKKEEVDYSSEYFPTIDESYWSEDLFKGDAKEISEVVDSKIECVKDSKVEDGSMDFWYNLFTRAGDMPDLPEF